MRRNNNFKLSSVFIIVGIIALTLGVTIAFFNYTRTGGSNTVRTGRISFISEENGNITLTNVFPITSEEAQTDTINAKSMTITVTGDTDYSEGVEYLISASDVNNTINNKTIPITLEVSVNGSGLGTAETGDYYDNRENYSTSKYKVENQELQEDSHILVGYISPNTTPGTASGINGSVMIKAYVDKDNILITDTLENGPIDVNGYDNGTRNSNDKTVFTTSEWNSLQNTGLSFKVKVEANEGIWVKNPSIAIERIKKNVDVGTLIDFSQASSSTNGQGLYILSGTESDNNPIYYYRGAIYDNNVVFGGYCWQVVRTTDTGGIKIIYNGIPDIEESGENTIYNCGIARSLQENVRILTNLSQDTGYYYADDYEIVSTSGNNVTYRLKSKTNAITQVPITNATDASTSIPIIVANYPYTCKKTTDTETCTTLYKVDSYSSGTNAYVYSSLHMNIIELSDFHSDGYFTVGYMNNASYKSSSSGWTSGARFAKSASWSGSSYRLTDASVTTPDATHHYSCNATTTNATCTSLRYVYCSGGTTKWYITLTNRELIEDALYKMTGTGSAATKTKNSGYNINVNNSLVKTLIDNWFRTNLTNEEDNSKINYQEYLEDTIYCNNRDIENTLSTSGWNPDGGSLTGYLYFEVRNRFSNGWYSTSNVPSMDCPNESDRFTVSSDNGNGALTYPVGLITADETIMAGIAGNGRSASDDYYLNVGNVFWTMSPSMYNNVSQEGYRVFTKLSSVSTSINASGVRPVVSLKPGIEFESGGDGTPTNPYVVKYN